MFREAFLPDRKARKPLLVREKPARSGAGWGTVFLWAVSLSVAVFTVFFSDFHTVRTIDVTGTRDIPADRIESFVRDRLSGKRFRIFPGDNFFLIPAVSLERDLLLEFPKLKNVSVSREFPDRVKIEVSERDRIFLWCLDGPCFLVGDDGRVMDARFSETPENEPFLLRVVDESDRPVGIGEPLLSEKSSDAIILLERNLRESGVVGITLPFRSPSRVSDEVRITTEEGWDLLVSLGIDPGKTIASLRLVLGKEIPADRRSALRYIDLRTENKAFFAYKDWTPPQDETTDPTAPPTASAGADKKTDEKKK